MLIVTLAIIAAAGATGGLAAFAFTGSVWMVLVAYSCAGLACAGVLMLLAGLREENDEPHFALNSADLDRRDPEPAPVRAVEGEPLRATG